MTWCITSKRAASEVVVALLVCACSVHGLSYNCLLKVEKSVSTCRVGVCFDPSCWSVLLVSVLTHLVGVCCWCVLLVCVVGVC